MTISMFIDQLVASLGMEEKKELIKMMMKMTVETTPLVMMTMAQNLKRVKEETPDSEMMRTQLTPHNPVKIVPLVGKTVPKIPPVRAEILTMRIRGTAGLREITSLKRVRVRSTGWEAAVRGIVAMGMALSLMMKECRAMIQTPSEVREATPE